MAQDQELDLVAVGDRIRSIRGALSQTVFAERLGVDRKTIGRYETGERPPDASALLVLMVEFGVDPAWVLTGAGTSTELTEDERELLALFRSAPLAVKMAAVGALQGARAAPSAARNSQTVNGPVYGGQVAGQIKNKRNK